MKTLFLHTTVLVFLFLYVGNSQMKEEIVTISNGFLTAKVRYEGAELISLMASNTGHEYIWQGDQMHWKGSSPVLFPIVGSLKNGAYTYKEKTYHLPQHGFAKDRRFDLLDDFGANKATFVMKTDSVTKRVYPFEFELRITYELVGSSLGVVFQVYNLGDECMFFSLGGHPGFNISMQHNKDNVTFLRFSNTENASIIKRSGKLLTTKTVPYMDNCDTIRINSNLFGSGALVFPDLISDEVELWSESTKLLSMRFHGFPYFTLWSKPNNPGFICLEPWYGIPDLVTSSGELKEKKGIVALNPKQEFEAMYTIKIH